MHLFAQLGSMRSVLLCLNREGLQLPHQIHRRGLGRADRLAASQLRGGVPGADQSDLRWRVLLWPSRYPARSRSRTRATSNGGAREAWEVFLPDHHPGYLSLEQWEANMARLKNHLWTLPTSQGAPREGAALLQGLVWLPAVWRADAGPLLEWRGLLLVRLRASALRRADLRRGRAPSASMRSSRTWCSA